MATSPKKITVKATAGRNEPVEHVVRLEDLLQRLQRPASKPARSRGQQPAAGAGDLDAVRQLAAELEARMRALRAMPTAAPAKRTGGTGKKD